jgi:crossover junction endodeoxyribonuclease RusA
MKIYIYPPDKRKRDIDGILKATLDSLQKAAVYDDDCQIKKLYCEMLSPIHLGKLLIEIAPLP